MGSLVLRLRPWMKSTVAKGVDWDRPGEGKMLALGRLLDIGNAARVAHRGRGRATSAGDTPEPGLSRTRPSMGEDDRQG
ncbi:MAG TPA: hypothetical protein VG817_09265 [Gemmatimonadales bacterium]|nr:hypothetical protein [Gemmatimonadales bacterium]